MLYRLGFTIAIWFSIYFVYGFFAFGSVRCTVSVLHLLADVLILAQMLVMFIYT